MKNRHRNAWIYLYQISIEFFVLLVLAAWLGKKLDTYMSWQKPISIIFFIIIATGYFLYKIYCFAQTQK